MGNLVEVVQLAKRRCDPQPLQSPYATQSIIVNTSFLFLLNLAAICHFQLPLAAFILVKQCPF